MKTLVTRIATGTAIEKPGKVEGVGMKSFSPVRSPVSPPKVPRKRECSRSCCHFSCNLWEVVLYAVLSGTVTVLSPSLAKQALLHV
ncbi:hypothetical protein CEXT_148071 [Caerostris extrusa]|uniref:Uncharacterized protein n=1 Tax=Caerostris extrusa TaxID=172846 RepID=A0AAV4S6X9_CAEEX|nr:hypothetical protein CEXT_148071 [Caerostris extrusa]